MASRIASLVGVFACVPLMFGCSSGASAPSASSSATPTSKAADIWVVAWGASPENATATAANPGGSEQTFRSFFYPTVAGTTERVRFSNYFGTTSVTIGAARLAVAAIPPAVDPAHDVALSFDGQASVTLAPGAEVASDPVNLTYAFGQKMAVTAYVQGAFSPLTQHASFSITNYNSAVKAGDATRDLTGASLTQSNAEWFLISGTSTVSIRGP